MRPGLAALLLATVVAGGCGENRERPGPRSEAVFALLADNRLLKVSPEDGRVAFERRLAPAPRSGAAGRYLALSRDGKTLFALVRSRGEVAVVDTDSGDVRERLSLPRGVVFGALAVGPTSGRVYVFGNRRGGVVTIRVLDEQVREESVVIAVIEPETGEVVTSSTVREAQGLDWAVYGGAVSPDESRLFVTYHGSSTSGVDWVDVSPGGLERCRRKPPWRGGACAARVHGAVEPHRDGFFGATGFDAIIEVGGDGAVRRTLRTRLTDTHLMELAVDDREKTLYAAGSCYHGAGLSAVDLATGRARVLAPPEAANPSYGDLPDACGDRIAVARDALLVLARTTSAAPSPVGRGKLVFVDGRAGRVVRTVETTAEPVDVLAAQP